MTFKLTYYDIQTILLRLLSSKPSKNHPSRRTVRGAPSTGEDGEARAQFPAIFFSASPRARGGGSRAVALQRAWTTATHYRWEEAPLPGKTSSVSAPPPRISNLTSERERD